MSNPTFQGIDSGRPSKALDIGLWVTQGVLCLLFAGTGVWKLVTPVSELAKAFPWMGQVSPTFLHATGVFDLLGGVGVVLPAVTRIKPGLTVLAALGCAVLQLCAVVFHVSRGEAANTPFNFFLVALSLFVCWGRRFKVPIAPRAPLNLL
jgi:hypothetical protein